MPRTEFCSNCDNWVLFEDTNGTFGSCRRHAPKRDDRTGIAVWPTTHNDHWCGDWEVPEQNHDAPLEAYSFGRGDADAKFGQTPEEPKPDDEAWRATLGLK